MILFSLAGLAQAILGTAPATAGPSATAALSSSAVIVKGRGEFANLVVTIGQTRNLIDQVVPITWRGVAPTSPDSSNFATDYLQVMQCWGNSSSGPTRDQCQFGALAGTDNRGGDFANTRQVNYGTGLVDPKETIVPSSVGTTAFVPFTSVTGVVTSGNNNQFFDANTTNEIAYGRTKADGTGQEFFETQTIREAAGLGCGELIKVNSVRTPRSCWLVIVPRNGREVNGSAASLLRSSPLSQTNWDNRLVVKLSFAAVGNACSIGRAERQTIGSEDIVEAIGRWQPALCAKGGPAYSFSQVNDAVAQRQLSTTQPGLAFLTKQVPRSFTNPEHPLVYAPVALSGLTISFLVESQSGVSAPTAIRRLNGLRLSSINLTPRLVAKLLTQSYRIAVDPTVAYLLDNPADMTKDPEFLANNPAFRSLEFTRGLPDILTPLGLASDNARLWQWIASDEAASNFIAGQSDQYGMRVNPFYQGMSLSTDSFPKSDPYCQRFPDPAQGPLCTLDKHAYAADMHDAARAVSRGDGLGRANWDPQALPPQYKKNPPLGSGSRALLAFADTASAARYGLITARLQNSSGRFVAPTSSSLLAGYHAMTRNADGTFTPTVTSDDPTAYPLTTLTYAVTAPSSLGVADARDYASLIRFAVGKGQTPGTDAGQLPLGYVPLPAELRSDALVAAGDVAARRGPTTQSTSTPTSSDSPPGSNGSSGGSQATTTGSATSSPGALSATPGTRATTPAADGTAVSATPVDPIGGGRLAVPIALAMSGVAALAAPLLPGLTQRLGG